MFQPQKLKYSYDALEPYLDTKTMEIHHGKHYQNYVNNLNKALEKYPEWQNQTLEKILTSLHLIPGDVRVAVVNNAGGSYNHQLYFDLLAKNKKDISSDLLKAINRDFESLENLKATFYVSALSNFGSGWTWLCLDREKKLKVINTSNQDCPLTNGYLPILCADVWEHAYYLKFQNRRNEHLETFWEVINWEFVSNLYHKYI